MSSTMKQAIEALKTRLADAYSAIVAKGGTLPTTQDSANLPAAIESIPSREVVPFVRIDANGVVTSWQYLHDRYNVAFCDLSGITQIGNYQGQLMNGFRNIETLYGPDLITINGPNALMGLTNLKVVDCPALKTIGSYFILRNCTMRVMNIPHANVIEFRTFYDDYYLIDLITGYDFDRSYNFSNYNPTYAMDAGRNDLVEEGESFTNNREKWLFNLREHFANNLPTITAGYSITFSAAVKAAILADQETADAFTNKGWTVA